MNYDNDIVRTRSNHIDSAAAEMSETSISINFYCSRDTSSTLLFGVFFVVVVACLFVCFVLEKKKKFCLHA